MIFVGMGSNQGGVAGRPAEMLEAALGRMAQRGILVSRQSALYRTDSEPDPSEPKFLNMVVQVNSHLGPSLLLKQLHAVETELGRRRRVQNEPRSIDLDLLDYDGRIHSHTGDKGAPVLPHPRLFQRSFVLRPLNEICPNWRHPVTGKSGYTLLRALARPNSAQRLG